MVMGQMVVDYITKISEEDILAAADALEPRIRQTFLNAIEILRQKLPLSDIEDLLEEGQLADALNAIGDIRLDPEDLAPIEDAILAATTRTAEITAGELALDFQLVNPRAVRFAQETAAALVQGVDVETMKAIRDIIVHAQTTGLDIRTQRNLISDVVGLTRRDAAAVERFTQGLFESGASQSFIRAQRERMARRLLLRRAENIARTETIRAANMGTQLAWESALDAGLLPQGVQKVWIATEDSRTCPICMALDGQVVEVVGGFELGETAEGPLKRPITTRTPPAHPSCRCTIGISEASQAEIDRQPPPPTTQPLGDDLVEAMEPTGKKEARTALQDRLASLRERYPTGTRERDFIDWADKWTEASSQTRFRNDIEKVLQGADLDKPALKRAKTVLDALETSTYQKPDTLYRGMTVKGGNIDNVVSKYVPGERLDLNLSSFSSDRKVANKFASDNWKPGSNTRIRLEWEGDGTALPLEKLADFNEFEWVGGGQFEISSVRKYADTVIVTIRQVASLGLP